MATLIKFRVAIRGMRASLKIREGRRIISLQFILPCSCEDGLDAFKVLTVPVFHDSLDIQEIATQAVKGQLVLFMPPSSA